RRRKLLVIESRLDLARLGVHQQEFARIAGGFAVPEAILLFEPVRRELLRQPRGQKPLGARVILAGPLGVECPRGTEQHRSNQQGVVECARGGAAPLGRGRPPGGPLSALSGEPESRRGGRLRPRGTAPPKTNRPRPVQPLRTGAPEVITSHPAEISVRC